MQPTTNSPPGVESVVRSSPRQVQGSLLPAISTGIYGYPLARATKIAVDTCVAAPDEITEIRFVCFDAKTKAVYEHALDGVQGD